MQSAYRPQKGAEEIYVVHLAIRPLPFETHICIVLLLLKSSGQSLRRSQFFSCPNLEASETCITLLLSLVLSTWIASCRKLLQCSWSPKLIEENEN
jgi:hypothetical protein